MKLRDYTAFMQNRRLGVELTFRRADSLDVPRPELAPAVQVLSNIRLHGPGSSTHAAFPGELPFGLRFGDTREALIAKFGPPDSARINLAAMYAMRWDTKNYALFAILDKAEGGLALVSMQVPVVASERKGFRGEVRRQSMIPKSGHRFPEKIMLKQKAGARLRFNEERSGSRIGRAGPRGRT